MTMTQIKHFTAVAETLSFTQAANKLYVSQPAISKSISKLENELGFMLFERSDSGLSFTFAGKRMYDFFSHCAIEYNALTQDIYSLLSHSSKALHIGCPETWSPSFFYEKLETHFSKNHPETRLIIECHKLSELIARLQSGKLDIILTHNFYIPSLPELVTHDLITTDFGILYSKAHFKSVRSLTDFADTPFLLFDSDIENRFSGIIRTICGEYGIKPKIINCNQLPSAIFNTACGKGIMLFSSWDSAVSDPSFGFFPVNATLPIKVIHFSDNTNSAVPAYADDICQLFGTNQ